MHGIGNAVLRLAASTTLAAVLAACQPHAGPAPAADARAEADLAFARSSCGGCHAVDRRNVSPSPAAPPFAAIVNRPGLTRNTLAAWLRNAHNYPREMSFSLDRADVDRLSAYMLTLRDPDYRPPQI